MIVFEKVTLQNFLSYGNDKATLNLQRKNPTLITGINHDASINGEMDSNGCGKSSLLMAITFALYDVALGKEAEKKDNLINNINKKDLLVELEFTVQSNKFKISRYRKNKAMGGNGVKIEKNKKDITPDSIANANSYIAEQILQVPYEIFSRIITYAANEESFLKLPLAKQREVIEELFSYTELTKKADVLKEQIKASKSDLKYAINSEEEIKAEHAKHQKSLTEAKENISIWEVQHNKEIADVKNIISTYDDFDFDKEEKMIEEVESHLEAIKELEANIQTNEQTIERYKKEQAKFEAYDGVKADKISALTLELSEKYEKFDDLQLDEQLELFQKKDSLKSELSDNKSKLSSNESIQSEGLKTLNELEDEKKVLEHAKCPYCFQDYTDENAEAKLEDVKTELKQLSKALRKSIKDSEKLEKEIEECETKIEETSKLIEFDNVKSVEQYRLIRNSKRDKLSELEIEENPHSDRTSDIEKLTKTLGKLVSDLEHEQNKTPEQPKFNTLKELYAEKNSFEQALEKKTILEKQENPFEKSLETLENFEIKDSKSDEIDSLTKDIKHQEFLLKLLTKKDSFVRKALMDKYLPFLNERLRYYLTTMGLPHKAQFKSDLSMEISQFDREITFTSLSSGQKARINIALSLAFRDVLQSKHNFINLYILDECLDVGLSNVGVRKTVKLIKEVAEKNKLSMFIISHRDEIKDSFKDQLEIELKNGFSSIKSS